MEYYSWILAFHIMSFISWMAMLFYMPRLFVYHREYADKEDFIDIVKIQELKLYRYIGHPAMWATIFSGGFMIYLNLDLFKSGGWLHAKLLLAVFLIAYSFSLNIIRKKLALDPFYKSGKFFRFYNEVPTILMIGIVIMVVIRPF
jgi:putative membrane protein